jgi:hypothetical protein
MTPGVTVNFFRFFGDGRFFPYFGLVIFSGGGKFSVSDRAEIFVTSSHGHGEAAYQISDL